MAELQRDRLAGPRAQRLRGNGPAEVVEALARDRHDLVAGLDPDRGGRRARDHLGDLEPVRGAGEERDAEEDHECQDDVQDHARDQDDELHRQRLGCERAWVLGRVAVLPLHPHEPTDREPVEREQRLAP